MKISTPMVISFVVSMMITIVSLNAIDAGKAKREAIKRVNDEYAFCMMERRDFYSDIYETSKTMAYSLSVGDCAEIVPTAEMRDKIRYWYYDYTPILYDRY